MACKNAEQVENRTLIQRLAEIRKLADVIQKDKRGLIISTLI